MINKHPFSGHDWLMTTVINGFLIALYGLVIYWLLSSATPDRNDLAVVLFLGCAIAYVFALIANLSFFYYGRVVPEAVLIVSMLLQGILFFSGFRTILFFWGASLLNYGVVSVYYHYAIKKR